MFVRFKKSDDDRYIHYKVLSDAPSMQFDDVIYKSYVLCHELEVLGFVPVDLLVETTKENIPAIDVAIKLSV